MFRFISILLLLWATPALAHNVRWCSNPSCVMCARLQAAHNASHPHPHGVQITRPVTKTVYAPTPRLVINRALKLAELKHDSIFVDLGSGDGRVVVTAAWLYGCRAVGVEKDPLKVEQSKELARMYGVDDLVKFYCNDVSNVKLENVDAVYVWLEADTLSRLVPRFKTMKRGARIISYQHKIGEFAPQYVDRSHNLYLWTDPKEKRNEVGITISSEYFVVPVRRRGRLTWWRM